ncbi:MAG: DUF2911 domain-containing protein [Saprospiraceae bacterium]|nr:DUF2911 domain-containing protein [Saprospiraceae bacterium]
MKKIALFGLLLVFAFATTEISAQERRAPSPGAKLEQKVGLTDVTIEYSRPSMKDRKIMGELVPYGSIWRTGANTATKITFSDDVTIEGKSLMAGSYAILTMPGMDSWGVMFYKFGEAGFNTYVEKEPDLKVMVEPVKIDCNVESFLINVDELRDNSASIQFIWENTMVPVSLGVK